MSHLLIDYVLAGNKWVINASGVKLWCSWQMLCLYVSADVTSHLFCFNTSPYIDKEMWERMRWSIKGSVSFSVCMKEECVWMKCAVTTGNITSALLQLRNLHLLLFKDQICLKSSSFRGTDTNKTIVDW